MEHRDWINLALRVAGLAVLALVLLVVLAVWALSHEWYDAACCNDRDCAPVPFSSVTEGHGGWTVTLEEGDHPLVHSHIQRTIPYESARDSQDDRFHACTLGGGIICLYVPAMAY